MDRADVPQLDVERIAQALKDSDLRDRWNQLANLVGGEAAELLTLVCSVSPPDRISELRDLETEQDKRGAGFLGMLPDQIPDNLNVPLDLDTSIGLAIQLANIRAVNFQALSDTMPQYATSFTGRDLDLEQTAAVPAGWALDIDVSGIRAMLDFFDAKELEADSAIRIAEMSAFVEMMRHRRELGYVPEPLIDAEGLAWCLTRAASHDPIDELWKWLHPHNLFDLSDLYAHRAQYRSLIDRLVKEDELSTYILGRIAPYAPSNTAFEDRLSFALGWGIRGWATGKTGGINIEHIKDGFPEMLPTLIHETFHRLQTSIAFVDPTVAEPGFDRITSYPFDSIANRQLYQALCYIMLEGSATYVAAQGNLKTWQEDANVGLEILNELRSINCSGKEDSKYDELLNAGLLSNGPFYGLGALLSHAIVEDGGPSSLGVALQRGAPCFIERGFERVEDMSLNPPKALVAHIELLRNEVESDKSRNKQAG